MDTNTAGAVTPTAAPSTAAPAPAAAAPPVTAATAAPDAASDDSFDEVAPAPAAAGTAAPPAATTEAGAVVPPTAATPPADETTVPTPADAPLPFADELGDEPAQPTVAEINLAELGTPEAILKAINPDGKVSTADQVKTLTTLVGKHSQEMHAARGVMEIMHPYLAVDQAGKPVGLDYGKIIETMPMETAAALAEAKGLKLVPKEWGPEQVALDREYPQDLVDQLVPDKELSFEEKVEVIKADADKLFDLRMGKRDRAAARADQQRQQGAVAERELANTFQSLSKSIPNFDALGKRSGPDQRDSFLDRANAAVPAELTGAVRANLVCELAQYYRLKDPSVRKKVGDEIYKRAEQDLLKKRSLGAPTGGGGIHVGAGGGNSADEDPAFAE